MFQQNDDVDGDDDGNDGGDDGDGDDDGGELGAAHGTREPVSNHFVTSCHSFLNRNHSSSFSSFSSSSSHIY